MKEPHKATMTLKEREMDTTITHNVKILPDYFNEIIQSRKTFEIRKNDRQYIQGDYLFMNEYNTERKEYTGRSATCKVTYILRDFEGIKEGYVAMSIEVCNVMF